MSIKKGQILAGRFNYGCEIHSCVFYEVMDVSANGMATLRELESEHRYYPGPDGNIYFNTPEEVFPTKETKIIYDWKKRCECPRPLFKRKIHGFGSDYEYVKTTDYETATVWDGRAESVYNLH